MQTAKIWTCHYHITSNIKHGGGTRQGTQLEHGGKQLQSEWKNRVPSTTLFSYFIKPNHKQQKKIIKEIKLLFLLYWTRSIPSQHRVTCPVASGYSLPQTDQHHAITVHQPVKWKIQPMTDLRTGPKTLSSEKEEKDIVCNARSCEKPWYLHNFHYNEIKS